MPLVAVLAEVIGLPVVVSGGVLVLHVDHLDLVQTKLLSRVVVSQVIAVSSWPVL